MRLAGGLAVMTERPVHRGEGQLLPGNLVESEHAELGAFRSGQVWLSLAVTVLAYGGMFGAFTYIAYTLTEVSGFASSSVPWLLVLFGAGQGIVVPHMFAACAAATPAPYRTRMLGFLRSTYYGGPLMAQVSLEVITARLGPTAAVAAIAVICVAGALAAVAFRKTFVPVEEAATHG